MGDYHLGATATALSKNMILGAAKRAFGNVKHSKGYPSPTYFEQPKGPCKRIRHTSDIPKLTRKRIINTCKLKDAKTKLTLNFLVP